jgi:hypothetical protein
MTNAIRKHHSVILDMKILKKNSKRTTNNIHAVQKYSVKKYLQRPEQTTLTNKPSKSSEKKVKTLD